MKKILVITGPTAVGKTKLSIELAKKSRWRLYHLSLSKRLPRNNKRNTR